MATTFVLYVCLGNIIRSPAAEAILRALTCDMNTLTIQSCAVAEWSLGEAPDPRMVLACKRKGYEMMPDKRARLIQDTDFLSSDYIFAADLAVYQKLKSLAPIQAHDKIQMMTAYSHRFKNESVPDPYYSDAKAFDFAVDMIEDSCQQFVQFLKGS